MSSKSMMRKSGRAGGPTSHCLGKVAFDTMPLARRVADRRRRNKDKFGRQRAYRCPSCGRYHIGENSA